jgi:hypothetical protein
MNPIFTLPYAEFCVAQQLSGFLPRSKGYSVFAPVSREETGVDLLITRRGRHKSLSATIQVKSSRTYQQKAQNSKRRFSYRTWFNNFDCPAQADFFCLVALYPSLDLREYRERRSWWHPVILLFSQQEMRRFLRSVKTVGGTPHKMFGFGFDAPTQVFQTRGDRRRRFLEFSTYLLPRRVRRLKEFLR